MISIAPKRTIILLSLLLLSMTAPVALGGWRVLSPLFSIPAPLLLILLLLLALRWYTLGWRSKLVFHAHASELSSGYLTLVNLAGEFLGAWTPGNVGKYPAWFAFLARKGITTSLATATGAVNMLFDWAGLLCLLLLASISLLLADSTWLPVQITLGLVGLVGLVTCSLLFLLWNHRLIQWICNQPWGRCFPARLHSTLYRIKRQLPTLLENTRRLPFPMIMVILFVSLIYWAARLSLVYLAVLMIQQYISWPSATLIQFASATAGALTLLPGGFPGADLSMNTLLNQHLSMSSSLTVILLWRLMSFHINLAAGGLAFLWLSCKSIGKV